MLHADHLSRNLKHIANLYFKLVANELQLPQLSNYFDVLLTISRHNSMLTQKQLGDLIYVDKSHMVAIVYRLTENGLLQVKQNTRDRREKFIVLTAKGKQLIPLIEAAGQKINHGLLNGIDKEKLNTFFEVLASLDANLSSLNNRV